MTRAVRALAALLLISGTTSAQSALPIVEVAETKPLRAHAARLLRAHESSPVLPPDRAATLRMLLSGNDGDFAERLQKALDPHCLVAVHINPESRVKAARGPASATLILGRDAVVLIKVHNEAGVTDALRVDGPQQRRGQRGGWLEAAPVTPAPLGGDRLEYVLLRLKPFEAGKREATLRFDVGQGTQDLGFRAEVPVLFDVRREDR
jgi:hypothetical protein